MKAKFTIDKLEKNKNIIKFNDYFILHYFTLIEDLLGEELDIVEKYKTHSEMEYHKKSNKYIITEENLKTLKKRLSNNTKYLKELYLSINSIADILSVSDKAMRTEHEGIIFSTKEDKTLEDCLNHRRKMELTFGGKKLFVYQSN